MPVWLGNTANTYGNGVFIADNARILGDVRLDDDASIFFGSVIRGDINFISIGRRSNIQDLCCIHVADDFPCIIGNDVVVGHHCVLHGCTVEDAVLVGIGSIVLNDAKIGYGSIIGAGTLITQGTIIPPYSLVLGSPGKIIKKTSQEDVQGTIKMAHKYMWVKNNYLNAMKK